MIIFFKYTIFKNIIPNLGFFLYLIIDKEMHFFKFRYWDVNEKDVGMVWIN